MNVLAKYADDINLLVPSDSVLDLAAEFDSIKQCDMGNRTDINLFKTKEIVFGRHNHRLDAFRVALGGVEQVSSHISFIESNSQRLNNSRKQTQKQTQKNNNQ